jgi:hypothetical protein
MSKPLLLLIIVQSSSIADVHKKTNALHDNPNLNKLPQQPPQPVFDTSVLQHISDNIKNLRFEVANMQAINNKVQKIFCLLLLFLLKIITIFFSTRKNSIKQPMPQVKCPETVGCLTTFYFVAFIVCQTLLFVIYLIYK